MISTWDCPSRYTCYTFCNGRLVHLRGAESLVGEWAHARITGSNTYALFGEIVE